MQTTSESVTGGRVTANEEGAPKKGGLLPRFIPFTLVWTASDAHTENESVVITFASPLQAGQACAIKELKVAPEERGKGLGRAVAALFLNEACEFCVCVCQCYRGFALSEATTCGALC